MVLDDLKREIAMRKIMVVETAFKWRAKTLGTEISASATARTVIGTSRRQYW